MYTFLAGSVHVVLVNNTQPLKFTDITVTKYNLAMNLEDIRHSHTHTLQLFLKPGKKQD